MKKILLALLTILLLSSCTQSEPKQYTGRTLSAGFDTEIVLIGYTKTEKEFNEYFDLTKAEFIRYNALFDNYASYEGINNIKTINDNAGIQPVVVDQAIIDVLNFVKEYESYNNDKFDPTLGAVLQIWHDYREAGMLANQDGEPGAVPSFEELTAANALTGWDTLEIDDENNTVFLNVEGAALDLGGIAKGWVTEQVALTLEAAGLTNGALNAGGNVRTINNKPDGPWRIGVARPSTLNSSSIDTITIDGSKSMVTSGDYQRYYTDKDGNILHHLIDPVTLMPSTHFRSVTIIVDDSGLADLFSTIIFLEDYETGKAILNQYNTDHPEEPIGAIWVINADDSAPSSDFFTIEDGEFQIAVSDNYHELSRAYQAQK